MDTVDCCLAPGSALDSQNLPRDHDADMSETFNVAALYEANLAIGLCFETHAGHLVGLCRRCAAHSSPSSLRDAGRVLCTGTGLGVVFGPCHLNRGGETLYTGTQAHGWPDTHDVKNTRKPPLSSPPPPQSSFKREIRGHQLCRRSSSCPRIRSRPRARRGCISAYTCRRICRTRTMIDTVSL